MMSPHAHSSTGTVIRVTGDKLIIASDTLRGAGYAQTLRGNVTGFSRRSRTRMRDYLLSARSEYVVMGTLTYPIGLWNGSRRFLDCKRDLRVLADRLRRSVGREGALSGPGTEGACGAVRPVRQLGGRDRQWSFFWFVEFTNRGVPHFHFYCTHYVDKAWLARAWFEIVGSGNLCHLQAGTRIERLRIFGRGAQARYATKYALKLTQKSLPSGERIGRWWGVQGSREVLEADTFVPDGVARSSGDVNAKMGGVFDAIDALTVGKKAERIVCDEIPANVEVFRVRDFADRERLVGLIESLRDEVAKARERQRADKVLRQTAKVTTATV